MQIQVNGEALQVPENVNLAWLTGHLDVDGLRIAIEVNRDIVPRSAHATRTLHNGDRIEIINAIGGG